MMTPIKIFWIEPIDRERRWLRRFQFGDKKSCPKASYGCNAMFEIGEADILYTADGYISGDARSMPPRDDPRWPRTCEACGCLFDEKDEYQLHGKQIYIRPDTGARFTLKDAPAGAVWDAWWWHHRERGKGPAPLPGVGSCVGPDGRSLVVKCPDGWDWMIDARASNCTLPNDDTHHCWVRHGKPEDGTLHVDKAGNTCAAGAGSIMTPNWHGFLHHGMLHE
ncbi:hypothetical protein [Bradyrhizobium sp. SZCCHNRI2049]|uniref:hypothetical protein n=1 Tax=Bradyrhizobium sp. SZCCHNRI2049 TaxID=3057287 RepID=UPI002916618B|nr:hypothetical protein [Bradyrhizobium sp. SZCCHNRI2049]